MPDFVPILILLFLLSQVSERLGNVIKLYIVDRFIPNVPNDPYLEKKKEKKTIITSLVAGFIISFFYEVYDKEDVESLKYLELNEGFWPAVARILLGTLLMAFGSKFWHDILDVVFYYKKIKQVAASGEIFKVDEVKLLEEHVELHGSELARRCVEQNSSLLDRIPNSTYGIMPISKNGRIQYVVAVYAETDADINTLALPSPLTYRSSSGTIYQVPIELIATGKTVTQESYITRAGQAIANAASPDKKGTFGCLMKHKNPETHRDENVIVTCYHVVKSERMIWEEFNPKNPVDDQIVAVRSGGGNEPIGKLTRGERTRYHDIALVIPTDINKVANISYQTISIPTKWRRTTAKDVENKIRVRFRGINSRSDRIAKLINREYTESITYGDDNKHKLSNLLVISAHEGDYKNPSAGGDSGAIVYDDDNYAIGMIVAGNEKFGYAIPFCDIIEQYNLKSFSK